VSAGVFRDDGSVDFPQVCAWGPGDIDWIDPILSACGGDKLGERERYMADHVYVNGPRGRIDAELSGTMGEPIPHPGSLVQLGDRMLVVRGERVDDIRTDTAVLFDPVTGVEEELWERTGEHDLYGVGGREGAVLVVVGASTLIDLPAPPDGLQQLVSAVEAVDDGMVVQLESADVSVEGDAISIGVHGYGTWRYQDESKSWTLLTTGLYMLTAGTDSQGRVVGSTFSDAGRALVAYDPDTDQLLVSDEVCLWDDYPHMVTGDTLWLSTTRAGERVYEPIHLAQAPP